MTSPTRMVSTAHDTTELPKRGLGRPGAPGSAWLGQASWSRIASTVARASTSSMSTAVKPSQVWLNANSQRKSW